MKTFDCVESKHRAAEQIRKEIEGMTVEQELEYWKRQTDELRREQEAVKKAHSRS